MRALPESIPRIRAAVAALPRRPARELLDLERLVPSQRSVVAGLVLLALAAAAYLCALVTPAFAIRRVEVRGAPPGVAREVRAALAPLVGESLLRLDGGRVEALAEAVPSVASVVHDRAFPHALVVFVVPERPIAVVRRGAESWLVSARARVVERLPRRAYADLPRIWVARRVGLSTGATVADPAAQRAVAVLRALRRQPLGAHVRTVHSDARRLTLLLATGVELRFGDASQLALKLAVAGEVLEATRASGERVAYVDLAVPERPVAGTTLNSKVDVEG